MISVIGTVSVRYRAPELEPMARFLTDFGLVRDPASTRERLYMRASERGPVVHVTERGEPSHVGFTLAVESMNDLEALAAQTGRLIEERAEVEGGRVLQLEEPGGLRVDVVHDARAALVAVEAPPRDRRNRPIRTQPRPSSIRGLGHVAIFVPDLEASLAFFSEELGMQTSDTYSMGGRRVGAFLRCGLGQRFTPHHSVAVLGHPPDRAERRSRFDHAAFEVLDLDELMAGHEHLVARATYRHSWGVGRHIQGSQIFDYWRDPFGNKIEHWTDGDLVNDDYPVRDAVLSPAALAQWAPAMGEDFLS